MDDEGRLEALDIREALVRHGYDPDARPSGAIGDPPATWRGWNDVLLRQHVCELDGIEIDGHVDSDLDPGGGCMYCLHVEVWGR
jgi:hypothetical protein